MKEVYLFGEPDAEAKSKLPIYAETIPEVKEFGKVISIRGTSGSGKSYLTKSIMKLYDERIPKFRPGRTKPIYYVLKKEGHKDLCVVGSYETDCGGCDTIMDIEEVYDVVTRNYRGGRDVIFEGLLMACEIWRSIKIPTLNCIYLATPIEECLSSVNARRASKGKAEPVNPRNTESKFKSVKRSIERMAEHAPQIPCFVLERQKAFEKARELLGI